MLDRLAILVQADSTLISGAILLQMDAEEMGMTVRLFEVLVGHVGRQVVAAASAVLIVAQAISGTRSSPRV